MEPPQVAPGLFENLLAVFLNLAAACGFFMLAFFDASGTMGDSPAFVMAGYIGRVEDWERFTVEWQAALDQPKAIQYLRMSEAWARRGEFQGWAREDRDLRLKLLAPIINRYAIASILSVVPTQSWRKYFVGRLENSYHDRPYYFAFHGVMANVVKYLHQKGIKEKVDFIFDSEGGEPIAEIIEGFSRWTELAPDHLKEYIGNPPIFRSEKEVLPLQADDLIAWHVRRIFAEKTKEEDISKLTPISEEVFNLEHAQTVWTDAELKNAIEFVENRAVALTLAQMKSIPMTIPDPSSPWDWY